MNLYRHALLACGTLLITTLSGCTGVDQLGTAPPASEVSKAPAPDGSTPAKLPVPSPTP